MSLLESTRPGLDTLQAIWQDVVKQHPKVDYLGTQAKRGEAIVYEYETYAQVDELARRLGTALLQGGFLTHTSEGKVELDLIGIFSKNRKEWLYCDVSSFLYKFQLVPLYDTLGMESIEYILEQTQITTCFVTDQTVKTLLKAKNLAQLKRLVSYDSLPKDVLGAARDRGLEVLQLGELIAGTKELLPLA